MGARIKIDIHQYVTAEAAKAYSDLCDWKDHERWVPFTKVTIHSPQEFTAYTGIRPFVIKDRMRVTARNDEAKEATFLKLGPLLTGTAGFKVRGYGAKSCIIVWQENIKVAYLPGFLSKPLTIVARILFRYALRKLPRS